MAKPRVNRVDVLIFDLLYNHGERIAEIRISPNREGARGITLVYTTPRNTNQPGHDGTGESLSEAMEMLRDAYDDAYGRKDNRDGDNETNAGCCSECGRPK